MNTILLLRVGLFLALVLTAFLLLKYLKEHKVLNSVADSVYEKAKAQESERQAEQQMLILLEGRQEKTNLLYKLDLLVLQSNIRKFIPFASTEILLVMTIILSAAGYAGVAYLTRIYCFEGWLMELFTPETGKFSPGDGEKVLPMAALVLDITDGLLRIEFSDPSGERNVLKIVLMQAREVTP